ncbi:hypothetical protein [Endozoicomonas sp.]|uniref:hypothetical protein n=1 Tax=Endozoicomonas sp. TaxID=1892382 RepID=UPI002888E5F7|nr:hypothetical protein [Endozoicomonas sp.]
MPLRPARSLTVRKDGDPDLSNLLNMRDGNGRTPLQAAADNPEDDDPSDDPGNEKSETGKPNENTRNKREKPHKPPVDDEFVVTVPAEEPPPGSTRNGHVPCYIQECII